MSTSLAPEEGQYSIICGCPLLSHWHGTSHFSFLFLSWWFWIPLWGLFYLLFSFLLHSHGYFKPFEQSPVMRTYLYIQIFQNLKFVFQDLRPRTQQKQNFLRAPINSNTSLANIVLKNMDLWGPSSFKPLHRSLASPLGRKCPKYKSLDCHCVDLVRGATSCSNGAFVREL